MFKKFFASEKQLNDIYFLLSLKPTDYPYILKKICKLRTKETLNLSNPKTFLDKINCLKLYDDNPLRPVFTSKIAVREWITEQIGKQYLTTVYQTAKEFNTINFDNLPEKFIVKTNHAQGWEYGIKNKEKLLNTKPLFDFVKQKFDNWQKISYVVPSLFEMNYINIQRTLIIEEYQEYKEKSDFGVYCFNGEPKLSELFINNNSKVCIYDENFKESKYTFTPRIIKEFIEPSEEIRKAFELSKKLSKDFKFVRVDWKILDGKLYFDRMNFTPYSGIIIFEDEEWNKELGELIKL